MFLGLFLYVLNANLFALTPYYLALRGADEGWIGAAAGMLNLGGVVAILVYGHRADAGSRQRWVLGTMVLAGIGNLTAWLAVDGSLAWHVFATSCHGATLGLGLPAIFVWVAELGRAERRTERFAWLGIAGLLGDGLGPALGEALLLTQPDPDAPEAFWIVFAAANVLCPLACACFWRAPDATAQVAGPQLHGFASLLRLPELRRTLLGAAAFGGALGTMLSLGKNFVAALGLDFVSLLLGGHAIGAITVRLLLGWILRRFDRVRVISFALLGVATSMTLLALANGYPLVVAAGLVYGVSHGLLFPTLLSRLIDYGGPEAAGRISTLFMGMLALGGGVWPWLGGWMLPILGFSGLFGGLAVACVVALVLHRGSERLYRRRCAAVR